MGLGRLGLWVSGWRKFLVAVRPVSLTEERRVLLVTVGNYVLDHAPLAAVLLLDEVWIPWFVVASRLEDELCRPFLMMIDRFSELRLMLRVWNSREWNGDGCKRLWQAVCGALNRRVLEMRPREKLCTRLRGKWGSLHVKRTKVTTRAVRGVTAWVILDALFNLCSYYTWFGWINFKSIFGIEKC